MTVVRTLVPMSVLIVLIAPSMPQTFSRASLRAEEDGVFPIEEVSILDKDGAFLSELMRYGGAALSAGPCSATPLPGVKYPTLNSKSPQYGQVVFRATSPALGTLATPAKSRTFCFVVDSTDAASDKYNLLYFDANGDRDLTNDGKVEANEKPPTGLVQFSGIGGAASVFNCVELKGDAADAGADRFLPWMAMQNNQQPYLIFMSTVVRKGNIRIGETTYDVLLGNRSQGTNARVMLRLADATKPGAWKAITLNRLQQAAEDEFFTLSVDAAGQQLTVSPYRGEFGKLQIKAVEAGPKKLGITARLYSKNGSSLMAGDYYAEELQPEHRMPTGDYRAYLMIDYGSTRASLSTKGYDLPIRSDQPFQLELSDKPIVTFTTPIAGQVHRPGSVIRFKSMLQDRATGMLIRGLYDTTNIVRQRTTQNAAGETVNYPVYTSLVPTVSITDAAGKEIASGKMPFG